MTRVQADIEALKALRQVLRSMAARQVEALEAAEREISYTLAVLDEAERRRRDEVERCRAALAACLQAAAYAAAGGYWVDCSGYEYDLRYAEERLTRIIQVKVQVESAIASYRPAAERFRRFLEDQVPRAGAFLADRITALEAYYAARLMGVVQAVAAGGWTALMGGVIAAVRRSRGELSRLMGSMGEQVAAHILSEKFGLEEIPFDQPKHGFDRVFRAPGIPLIVMESKVSSSGKLHLGQTQAGQQGSAGWVAAQAEKMADPTSAQWSPANERIASLIQEMGPEQVPVVSVVLNPTEGTGDVYLRSAEDTWRLLAEGLTLSDTPSPSPRPMGHPGWKEGAAGGPEQKG